MARRQRTEPEHLVDGLTFDERLARVESLLLGTKYDRGLDRDHDETRARLERLESADRRRRLPFFLRWFVGRKGATT